MFKISFYVPKKNLESVKNAMFEAGAGVYEGYSRCCWQTQGEGQFLPEVGSNPFFGKCGVVERVDEYKVEMICHDSRVKKVLKALFTAHPYEVVAYDVVEFLKLEDFK